MWLILLTTYSDSGVMNVVMVNIVRVNIVVVDIVDDDDVVVRNMS